MNFINGDIILIVIVGALCIEIILISIIPFIESIENREMRRAMNLQKKSREKPRDKNN